MTVSSATFGGLAIAYDARVLSPRTWTLHQSLWALELLEQLPDGPILELCAGAGQIGLAVAAGSTLKADQCRCGPGRDPLRRTQCHRGRVAGPGRDLGSHPSARP